MSQHLSDLEGVETDIDDIIVHAKTEVKHDQHLHSVLERCEKINLTLNKEKCVFKCKEVTYIGHKLTRDGIKPDDNKVRAINEMPAPSDKKGVERLLGTVNYLGKFIPNLATVTEVQATSKRCTLLARNELPNYRYSIKMHDMLRTPKAKRKGAYDSFSSTNQAMGIGGHRPFHMGQV